jgi:hypothetical protein
MLSFLLGPNILLSNLFLNILSLFASISYTTVRVLSKEYQQYYTSHYVTVTILPLSPVFLRSDIV